MNSADDFRSGQSLSREPSRQGMKFMVERNHINVLRREVLRRVAESFLHDADFGKSVERIPFVMRPKNTKPSRCCIYKDRAILRFRVMAALGFRLEDEEDDSTPLSVYAEKALEREQPSAPILTVCDTACQGCIPARYYVTDACQNCIAHPCIGSCHFGAIQHIKGRSYIDPEKCRNCGMCHDACPYQAIVRLSVPCEDACPVKAIHKGENGRAEIDITKCISCGRCMRACPFGTVIERSEIVDVLSAMKAGKHLTAMMAPAIVGQFPGNLKRVVEALRELGFSEVLEVASGADVTTKREAAEFVERMKHGERFMTTSCCPGYVEAVRLHLPEMAPFVSSTSTPMHYCAEIAKERFPCTTTVFIGPCVAKRREALYYPIVDYVLTFEEVGALLEAKNIDVSSCAEHSLGDGASGDGRGYAISGGVAAAVKKAVGNDVEVTPLYVNGLSLAGLRKLKSYATKDCPGNLVEVMACEGGCVGGAGVIGDKIKVTKAVESFAKSGM